MTFPFFSYYIPILPWQLWFMQGLVSLTVLYEDVLFLI